MATITVGEWVAAWEAAAFAVPTRAPGAATAAELAELWGVSVHSARARINRLWREGQIKLSCMERQQTPDGRGCNVPLYVLTGNEVTKKKPKRKRGG